MATNNMTRKSFDLLLRVLGNAEVVKWLCEMPADEMGPREKKAWKAVHQHFNPPKPRRKRGKRGDTDSKESEETGDSTDTTLMPNPPVPSPPESWGPWKSFRKIQKLSRPQYLDEFFAGDETDADAFLSDRYEASDQMGAQLGWYTEKKDLGDAFGARYQYACTLNTRSEMDKARQCFTWMMWFDLVKLVRPDITGSRLGELVYDDVADLLREVYRGEQDQLYEVWKHLSDWCKWGMRLHHFCEAYGEGCIFFLAEKLTQNFISLKFTFTGDHHDKAFEYLDDLGLKELAGREDVHQLGRGIREYLIGPFAKYLPGMVEEWRRTRRRR